MQLLPPTLVHAQTAAQHTCPDYFQSNATYTTTNDNHNAAQSQLLRQPNTTITARQGRGKMLLQQQNAAAAAAAPCCTDWLASQAAHRKHDVCKCGGTATTNQPAL
jgi:rhamnose utilization protein RhaD (predicted bifunctional aldolase and dehydrogenase)